LFQLSEKGEDGKDKCKPEVNNEGKKNDALAGTSKAHKKEAMCRTCLVGEINIS